MSPLHPGTRKTRITIPLPLLQPMFRKQACSRAIRFVLPLYLVTHPSVCARATDASAIGCYVSRAAVLEGSDGTRARDVDVGVCFARGRDIGLRGLFCKEFPP